MTVARLKKSMDLRFLRVDGRFRRIDCRFAQVDRRFAQVDRRFAQVDRRFAKVDRRFAKIERRLDRIERTMVTKKDLARSAAATRRHFDVVAESMRDDFRIFAEAIGVQSQRLTQHESRITHLEQRPF